MSPIIKRKLRIREKKDSEMRRKVLDDDRITTRRVPSRRVWDLCANRVVPYWLRVYFRGRYHMRGWTRRTAWMR